MQTEGIGSAYSVSLEAVIIMLRQNLAKIVLLGIIVGGGVFGMLHFFATPIYEASAKMIVNSKQNQTDSITNDQITSSQKLVDTYAIIIRSRSVLLQVIGKLQLDMTYEELQKEVSVDSVDGTQIMQINVRNADREKARNIVSMILEVSPPIISDAVEAGSVKTIEEAYCSNSPIAPKKNFYSIVAALLVMILFSLRLVLALLSDNTYKNQADLHEDLGVPVIGVIPSVRPQKAQKG